MVDATVRVDAMSPTEKQRYRAVLDAMDQRIDRVPYGHHDPYGKTQRESVMELWSEGYSMPAIARELGMRNTNRSFRIMRRWIGSAKALICEENPYR